MLLPLLLACAQAVEPPIPRTTPPVVPGLSSDALLTAWTAWECAGDPRHDALAVIDFTLPSTEPRLWVIRPSTGEVLRRELVAHGQGTGDDRARRFSNDEGTHASSLGVFRAEETYVGKHGRSLVLDGLDPGFNDHARSRAIVVHGADYVSREFVREHGRLGRSWGCPAVSEDAAGPVIDALEGGGLLVAYYPDPYWMSGSRWLHCGERAQ